VTEPEPEIARTFIEHDLSQIHATPCTIEPSAFHTAVAIDNAGMFMAYRRVGFNTDQALTLLTVQLEAALRRGRP
jgi:hypothetical protein